MFFCFLWDDPLFNVEAPDPWLGDDLGDAEFLTYRRRVRLQALENLYVQIHNLKQAVALREKWIKEAEAREVWTINQLLPLVQNFEAAERVLINRKVNDIDPDFSFCDAVEVK